MVVEAREAVIIGEEGMSRFYREGIGRTSELLAMSVCICVHVCVCVFLSDSYTNANDLGDWLSCTHDLCTFLVNVFYSS